MEKQEEEKLLHAAVANAHKYGYELLGDTITVKEEPRPTGGWASDGLETILNRRIIDRWEVCMPAFHVSAERQVRIKFIMRGEGQEQQEDNIQTLVSGTVIYLPMEDSRGIPQEY